MFRLHVCGEGVPDTVSYARSEGWPSAEAMSTVLLETEEEEPFVMLVRYVAQRLDDKESAVRPITATYLNCTFAFTM